MKQEDKNLLLKYLCMALPYGVKVKVTQVPIELSKNETLTFNRMYSLDESDEYITVKPYLRPMSSMTEEEKVKLSQYACIGEDLNGEFIDEVKRKDCAAYIDWLNKNHFDYRGLIKKGLALEAPKGMYVKGE